MNPMDRRLNWRALSDRKAAVDCELARHRRGPRPPVNWGAALFALFLTIIFIAAVAVMAYTEGAALATARAEAAEARLLDCKNGRPAGVHRNSSGRGYSTTAVSCRGT